MISIFLLFLLMFFLILLRVPLVYSIGVAAIVILLGQGDLNPSLIPARMFKGIDSFVLAAIPFFLLSAEILVRGGLLKKLIEFSSLIIGHLRGGLAQVNILVSMLFAGIQASVTADSAAIGGLMIPAMIQEKYDKDFSVVVTATSSCIGPIIPPSILMILYAFLTNTSVASLFLGGAIPGFILGIALMLITHYWVLKRGYKKVNKKMGSVRAISKSGFKTAPAFLVPAIIVVGLVGGIATPTEAGVLACVAALAISGLVYRELTFSDFTQSLISAAYTTTVIWVVIAVSTVFSEVLVRNFFADKITNAISMVTSNPTGVLLLITIVIFILGMAIDTTPLLIMLASPLHKVAMSVGIDPIHLGVVLVMGALIGTISPPVSLILCLDCGIAKIPLRETFGIIWSYLLVMLGIILLCVLIPGLIIWLPNLLLK
jgi:tripartite ATP-independent transporter DctM subunit